MLGVSGPSSTPHPNDKGPLGEGGTTGEEVEEEEEEEEDERREDEEEGLEAG